MRHASKRLLILRRLWCTARTVAPATPVVAPATTTTMSRKAWLYASLFDAEPDEQDNGTHRRGKRP
jgi:hypothetical protein